MQWTSWSTQFFPTGCAYFTTSKLLLIILIILKKCCFHHYNSVIIRKLSKCSDSLWASEISFWSKSDTIKQFTAYVNIPLFKKINNLLFLEDFYVHSKAERKVQRVPIYTQLPPWSTSCNTVVYFLQSIIVNYHIIVIQRLYLCDCLLLMLCIG